MQQSYLYDPLCDSKYECFFWLNQAEVQQTNIPGRIKKNIWRVLKHIQADQLANVQIFPLPPSKPMPASCFDFCPRTSQSQSQSTSNGRCPSKSLSWEESKKSYSKLNSTIWCCQKKTVCLAWNQGRWSFFWDRTLQTFQFLIHINTFKALTCLTLLLYRDPCILVQSESYLYFVRHHHISFRHNDFFHILGPTSWLGDF